MQVGLPLKESPDLAKPLPNLFRSTFEQANREAPGEQWLRQQLAIFDGGSAQQRKRVLLEFLAYVQQNGPSNMEDLFSEVAQLFLIRLTAWFAMTLVTSFELLLQLRVFFAFLEYREQVYVRTFFESGVVVPLFQSLTSDFDIADKVRCRVLLLLRLLAANGRQFKEALCSQGIVPSIETCISDGLCWETLKAAGRLLCELFISNPLHQTAIFDALQDLLAAKAPLTRRLGAQAFISLLHGSQDAAPPLLCEPARHRKLVEHAVDMLDMQDLSVAADAYCLLCNLIRNFNCDELLFGFAMAQLSSARDSEDEWLRLELDAGELLGDLGEHKPQVGGHRHDMVTRIHANIAQAFAAAACEKEQDVTDCDHSQQQLQQVATSINVQFCQAFWAESGHILKWGLLLYLAKRNPVFCAKLVEAGLTETLLMCLLDVAHPVRQAAALAELHRLRVLSSKAESIAQTVLASDELMRAVTIDDFMLTAGSEGLARARYNLRNVQAGGSIKRALCSAKELDLYNSRLDRRVMSSVGDKGKSSASGRHSCGTGAFLTEAVRDDAHDTDKDVPRAGPGRFNVKRVPGDSTTGRTPLEQGGADDIPFWGFLVSFSLDPLNVIADEQTPLLQEVRSIERLSAHTRRTSESTELRSVQRSGVRTKAESTARVQSTPRRRGGRSKTQEQTSHCPTIQHTRALALCPLGPINSGPQRPARRLQRHIRSLSSVASSRETDLSMRCGEQSEFYKGSGRQQDLHSVAYQKFHKASLQHSSLCETTAGPDFSLGLSEDDSLMWDSTEEVQEVVHHTPMTAMVEVRHRHGDEQPVSGVQKRILHVAGPPYHECIAFEASEMERERHAQVGEVTRLLHPATRRRFRHIEAVGRFPRRQLLGSAQFPVRDRTASSSSPTRTSAGSGTVRVPQASANSARMGRRALETPLEIGKLTEKTAPPEATVVASPRMSALRPFSG